MTNTITDDLLLSNYQKPTKQTGNSGLGKDAFMQILVTQMQNQDPTKPMEDREFIAQMAQFSSLEQMQNMTKAMEALLFSQQQSQLMDFSTFVGKEVQWNVPTEEKDSAGKIIMKEGTGIIQKVKFVDGSPVFTLPDGKEITAGNISAVLSSGATPSVAPIVQASQLIGKTVSYVDGTTEIQARIASVSTQNNVLSYTLDNGKKVTGDQFTMISQ